MKKLKMLFTVLTISVMTTFAFAQSDTTGTGGGTGSSDPLELIFLSVATLAGVVSTDHRMDCYSHCKR
jgi:hypothetical protein